MMHADLEQPIQLDDFDDPNASAVRNLYLRPDTPAPAADDSHGGADASPGVLNGELMLLLVFFVGEPCFSCYRFAWW